MRNTPRIHILVIALLLMAAGLAFGAQDTSGNQQGPGMSDRLGNLNGLCRLNGGTPGSYSEDTVKTRLHCKGGALDGLYCDVYADLTYCYWDKVGTGSHSSGGLQEVTTNVPDLTFVTDLSVDPINPFTLDVAPQPMLVEAVISWNPSTDAATQAREIQINACRHLGGSELVAGEGESTHMILCEGGMLDAMWCSMGIDTNTCFFEPSPSPESATTRPATVTPTEPPMPTETASTETPTKVPTEIPTPTAPMEPTDEPVIEPTFIDENQWPLPEGTLAPLEPAPEPTEAPLR